MRNIFTLSLALSSALLASEITIDKITVNADSDGTTTVKNSDLITLKNPSDTASLLSKTPGISLNSGGGFSSLPSINGMADDRINTTVDGMQITSACPNHMNPALSYIDPSKVEKIEAVAGIVPVSNGGDSIAGSIAVKSKSPLFANETGKIESETALSLFYRSNNHNQGGSISTSVANDKISVNYSGFAEKAENYYSGGNTKVADTLYKQQNQSLSAAYKASIGVFKLTVGEQRIPYQGFPNQYMDMNGNKSTYENLSFDGKLGNTGIEANVFKKLTSHYMNKITSERTGNMPMYTAADELGYNIKATIPLSKEHTLKVGSDFDKYRLNDWWPADTINNMPGMNPNTFWNINNGQRDRLGIFAESNYRWSEKLFTNIGIRTDIVTMNTGDVVGYNSTSNDPSDAAGFNTKNRKKTDNNYDITASIAYEASKNSDFEFGVARKTRSPNIYERYAWAGGYGSNPVNSAPIAMDMAMINWVGDGNGYVGNIDLKPEVANTVSATMSFYDETQKQWSVKITPYYTFVENYIDADYIGIAAATGTYKGITLLRFANHDAVFCGANVSANANLYKSDAFGKLSVKTVASYTRGYRTDGSGSLYHIMPLNAKIGFEHTLGNLTSGLDIEAVASKEQVSALRKEPTTPGYALVDLRTSYKFAKFASVDFSITNLFDKSYALPLGGINTIGTSKTAYTPLRGEGRSYNTAINIKF